MSWKTKPKLQSTITTVFGSRVRQTPAIDSKRAEILELLQSKNCIIVKGFSGCGKTTPQFILDDCYQKNSTVNLAIKTDTVSLPYNKFY